MKEEKRDISFGYVYSADEQDEIRRIVKIFTIAKDQRKTSKKIGARGLAAFRAILVSNN